jgi:hypothetical protein
MTPVTHFSLASVPLTLDCSTWSAEAVVAHTEALGRWVLAQPCTQRLRVCLPGSRQLRPVQIQLQALGCTVVTRTSFRGAAQR